MHRLTPISISALLASAFVLFQGRNYNGYPLTILWIAIPLFIQSIFTLRDFVLARLLRLSYHAVPSAMIGASHFEVAIATATMLLGLSSGAALATVVGVLIEVPVMLMLVSIKDIVIYLMNVIWTYHNVSIDNS